MQRSQLPAKSPAGFSLADPANLWIGFAALVAVMLWVSVPLTLALITAIVATTATEPLVRKLQRATEIKKYTHAAALMSGFLVFALGLVLWYSVPLIAQGIRDINAALPHDAAHWHTLLESVREELESVVPAATLDKLLEQVKQAQPGGAAALAAGNFFGKLGSVVGHAAIGFVFYLMLSSEWEELTEGARANFRAAFPTQADDVEWLASRFQENLIGICKAVLKIMAFFAPVYGLVFWYLGVPAGKAAVYGLIAGGLGGLPIVGGFLMHFAVWPIGFWEFVLPTFTWSIDVFTSAGAKTWYLLVAILGVGHLLEAKFITPKVLGDHARVKAIFILVGLVMTSLLLGLVKGLILGFALIALGSAWYDLVQRRGHVPAALQEAA
jgi:predicted PurR-regulated permease PerM